MLKGISRMTGAVAGLVLSLGMIAPSVTAVAAEGYDFDSASSLQVVVNKHRQLNPAAYVPGQLVRVQGGTVAGAGRGRLQAVCQSRQGGRREHHADQRLPFVQPAGQPL